MEQVEKFRVVTLGTAGGPAWWPEGEGGDRQGISTGVCVDGHTYVIDFGMGSARQLSRAGIPFTSVKAAFVTHLHSDHVTDLANWLLFGMYQYAQTPQRPIPVLGPGDRGELPPVNPVAVVPPAPLYPESPTPGITELMNKLMSAYATDLNERVLDSLRVPPHDIFSPTDIELPAAASRPTADGRPPSIDPWVIYQDQNVTVSATLVQHPPVWPAFAFRIDSRHGSVVISGDTAICENLKTLAHDADLLLHEAIDPDYIDAKYGAQDDPLSQASAEHHRKSHAFPTDVGALAEQAGVKKLALHHLVPGDAPLDAWRRAQETFSGEFILPQDQTVIDLGGTHE